MMRLAALLTLGFLSATSARAASSNGVPKAAANRPAVPHPSAPPRDLTAAAQDPLLVEGLKNLYDLDYALARANAEAFMNKNPDNPLGHLYMAGTLWWEVAGESWGRPGAASDELWNKFESNVDATLGVTKSLIESEDASAQADGYFAAGMVLGLRGQMKLVKGKYFGAYRDGKKAIKDLKKCVKINPDYQDAYLGLGIFDYQVSVLPGVLKFGAKMLFSGTGEKKRGLDRIENAVRHGRFARQQAASFLLTLTVLHEKDWPRSQAITQNLIKDFPTSAYYRFVEAFLMYKLGDFDASHHAMLALFQTESKNPETFRRKQLGVACGVYGPQCLSNDNLDGALRWLTKAIEALPAHPPAGWEATLRLFRGMARDLRGHREGARVDYNKILDLPDWNDRRAWARYCWNKPCSSVDAVAFLGGLKPGESVESNYTVGPNDDGFDNSDEE